MEAGKQQIGDRKLKVVGQQTRMESGDGGPETSNWMSELRKLKIGSQDAGARDQANG